MKKTLFTLAFLGMAFLSVARPTLAQDTTQSSGSYQLLAPIPLNGVNSAPANSTDIATYIPNAIRLITALAGGIAVVMIMIGGFQYITSATVGGKSNGRDTIQNALVGLLLVIGAYTILNTINPALVKVSLDLAPIPATTTTGTPTVCVNGQTGCNTGTPSVTFPPCDNCVAISPSIVPQKPPGSGCKLATYGTSYDGQCTMNATIAGELVNLANKFGTSGWQVTEMYPSTVDHISGCHAIGTCVDTALSANPSSATIATLLKDVQASGFSSYEYEACGDRLTQLKNDPVLKGFNIKCETTTTGENAHLNQ